MERISVGSTCASIFSCRAFEAKLVRCLSSRSLGYSLDFHRAPRLPPYLQPGVCAVLMLPAERGKTL